MTYRDVAIINFAGRTAAYGSFCSHGVCTYIHLCLLTSSVAERSECSSDDGSAGNITFGCGLVEDRLLWAVSASVKRGSVSHRQVGLVAQLEVELRAMLASNATMLLQPLKCIAMPQQHIHSSSKANA